MSDENFFVSWVVPAGKWTVKKKFVAVWRITELQGYDAEYVDLCGPAQLKFGSRGAGHMNFGAVEAEIDGKMDDLDERVLRFTFEGSDEGDPIFGRGYCVVDGDEMTGRIFRHFGDEFAFKAKKVSKNENGA